MDSKTQKMLGDAAASIAKVLELMEARMRGQSNPSIVSARFAMGAAIVGLEEASRYLLLDFPYGKSSESREAQEEEADPT